MSEGFGARLRAERERRHISLAAIATSTKVNAALFEGLERDDVSRWPAGIFRRAFVRGYARAIGLDPEETLRDFLDQFPDPFEAAVAAEGHRADAGRPRRPRTGLRLTLADTPGCHGGGRALSKVGKRCAAVGLDAVVVLAVTLAMFVALGNFWMSLGIFALCYYTGATLVLGNTPGVRLFAARTREIGPDDSDERYFEGIGAIASVSDPLSSS